MGDDKEVLMGVDIDDLILRDVIVVPLHMGHIKTVADRYVPDNVLYFVDCEGHAFCLDMREKKPNADE